MKKIILCMHMMLAFLSCHDVPEWENDPENVDVSIVQIEIISGAVCRPGDVSEMKAAALLSDGRRKIIEPHEIEWSSDDNSVAFFDSSGLLHVLNEGRCTLTARYLGFLDDETLTVTDPSRIKLREIMYDALGSDTGREFIVITSISDYPADISGYSLTDGAVGSGFRFPDGTVIMPGEKISICSDAEMFSAEYGIEADMEGLMFTLNNSGETVFLFSAENDPVDAVYIEGGSSQYPEPEGYISPSPAAPEGNSLNQNVETGVWYAGIPANSLK